MKAIRNSLSVILFILFELAVGIFLFENPDSLTKIVLICFGIVLLVVGAAYLFRYFRGSGNSEKKNVFTLIFSIASLIIGAVCAIFPSFVKDNLTKTTVIFGIILILLGVYKAKSFNDAKNDGDDPSKLTMVSAAVSVALGIVAIINPFKEKETLFLGLFFVLGALLDFIALVLGLRSKE